MKKFTKILLTVATAFGLAACGGSNNTDPNEEIVNTALSQLTIDTEISSDFNLTTNGIGGVSISWVSDNDAIKINGSKATVTQSTESDINVKLTATATKDTCTKTRDFSVKVLKRVISTEYISISEVLNSAVGTKVTTRGVVTQIIHANSTSADATAFYLFDGNAALYVYGSNTAKVVKRGQDIILSGETSGYFKGSTLDRVTQLASPDKDSIVVVYENANAPTVDKTKFEIKTVAGLTADIANKENYAGKAYLLEGVRINYYNSGTYITMSVLDWSDNPNYSTDPAMNLYSGGSNNCEEYSWLEDNYNKTVDVIFAIEGTNSKGTKFRGAIMAVLAE